MPQPGVTPFTFQLALPLEVESVVGNETSQIIIGIGSEHGAQIGIALRNFETFSNSDGFLISGDPALSECFSKSMDEWFPVRLDEELYSHGAISIWTVSQENERSLFSMAQDNWKVSFGAIPNDVNVRALDYVPHTASSLKQLADGIEIGLRRHFATDQLHISPDHRADKNPYSSAALVLATFYNTQGLVSIESNRMQMPNVNIDLRPVVEDDFNARIRRARQTPTLSELANIEVKIERAERRHQEILKDCVKGLSDQQLEPLLTESVDLAFKLAGDLSIFEIKSATSENFNSQFEKGLVQVARYRWQFSNHYSQIRACVVIEKPKGLKISQDFFDFAESLDIELLLWDESIPWPKRVNGMVRLNLSYLEQEKQEH